MNAWTADYDEEGEWTPASREEELALFLVIAVCFLPWVAAVA